MNPGFRSDVTMTEQADNKRRGDSSFYNKAEYITASVKRKLSFSQPSFLFLIKEKKRLPVEIHSRWFSKDVNCRMKYQKWAISIS